MPVCPTCGSFLEYERHFAVTDATALVDLLRETPQGRERELYKAQDGGWYLTYGGGPVDPAIVSRLVGNGTLHQVYSNTDQAYWLGRTLDIDATMAERQRTRDRSILIYADGAQ